MTTSPGTSHRARRGFFRRHRALTVLCALMVVLALAVGGWLAYLQGELADVPTFEADLDRPGRPAEVNHDSVTLLLAGVDRNQASDTQDLRGMLESEGWVPGSYRSDAIMVLHLDEANDRAQLVSIPRDSYVPVSGHGRTKINAALSLGGPALLGSTVEDVTGMRIDHVVLLDFLGFRELTELLGGVEVSVSGQRRLVEGEEALRYVQDRMSLPRGDFDRMQRQQNFLRAVLAKVTSRGVMANPVTATRFVRDLSELVAVDRSLTPSRMRSLALDHRGLRGSDIRFLTAPHNGTGMVDGASIVRLDVPRTRSLFRAIADGNFESWYARNDVAELPPADEVP